MRSRPEPRTEAVPETAREITGARYAALGVMEESRRDLERFLVSGIDEDEQLAIGWIPRASAPVLGRPSQSGPR
jgi:hypothetical protein